MKYLLPLLALLGSCTLAPIYIVEHEDGHYANAFKYGLNTHVSYIRGITTYEGLYTDAQELDIVGAGLTAEQHLKLKLSEYRVVNDPYSYLTLYRFYGHPNDGKRYLELLPQERNNIKRAIILESFIIGAQLLLNHWGSDFFIHSWTEADRRGVTSFYKVTYKIGF